MQSSLPIPDEFEIVKQPKSPSNNYFVTFITNWLNRGLSSERHVELRIVWPLWLIPLVLLNQLVAPHPVWVVFIIALCGFYVMGYLWIRSQASAVHLKRLRVGSVLVAGDALEEDFELRNESVLPLLWAEFVDDSTVPDYHVGRIVACEGNNFYRWHSAIECKQRGLFHLGPHYLRFQDPLGLFNVKVVNTSQELVLIYPRVVQLPPIQLPRGDSRGGDRQRRPIFGNLPAATTSEYRPGDSLRYVHWISSARRGRLMVKDLEIEPSGNIWLVVDLDRHVQQGTGQAGTLEQVIIVTASLAAELLSGRDQRAVGLLAFAGSESQNERPELVQVLPTIGNAHIWPILAALAPVTQGELSLAALLASSRNQFGRRSTLCVITPFVNPTMDQVQGLDAAAKIDWIAELVHLKSTGIACSVVLVAVEEGQLEKSAGIQNLLARLDIPCSVVAATAPLPAVITFKRRRRVVRSTPTGGVVSYEVDEDVG